MLGSVICTQSRHLQSAQAIIAISYTAISTLVSSSRGWLLFLLEPLVRDLLRVLAAAAAALDLHALRLVRLQVVGEVGLFWGLWRGWDGEFLNSFLASRWHSGA